MADRCEAGGEGGGLAVEYGELLGRLPLPSVREIRTQWSAAAATAGGATIYFLARPDIQGFTCYSAA
ncbi:hypothetical protein GCM10009682_19860 [Luedemannella flava]|uniref:Uncharacterized protein n=1 Tax=Luedemannella flava TaxID=349316 RepID=A0ABN2LSI2_9ACTN